MQLKPEELRNEVLLSEGWFNETSWQKVAESDNVEVLDKQWNWAKKLQLEPWELRYEVFLSKGKYYETAWQKAAKYGNIEVLEKLWDWAKSCSENQRR
jgi:hypothetical protein